MYKKLFYILLMLSYVVSASDGICDARREAEEDARREAEEQFEERIINWLQECDRSEIAQSPNIKSEERSLILSGNSSVVLSGFRLARNPRKRDREHKGAETKFDDLNT